MLIRTIFFLFRFFRTENGIVPLAEGYVYAFSFDCSRLVQLILI